MIVGFPGETDAEFEETLSLIETVRFHSMFSFKYSRAAEHAGVEAAAGRRAGGGQDATDSGAPVAAAADSAGAHEAAVGQRVEVLVDSRSRRRDWEVSGRTTGNTVVNLPGPADWVGGCVDVEIRRAGPYSLWGEAGRAQLDTGRGCEGG